MSSWFSIKLIILMDFFGGCYIWSNDIIFIVSDYYNEKHGCQCDAVKSLHPFFYRDGGVERKCKMIFKLLFHHHKHAPGCKTTSNTHWILTIHQRKSSETAETWSATSMGDVDSAHHMSNILKYFINLAVFSWVALLT